jgi:hypothetical protein
MARATCSCAGGYRERRARQFPGTSHSLSPWPFGHVHKECARARKVPRRGRIDDSAALVQEQQRELHQSRTCPLDAGERSPKTGSAWLGCTKWSTCIASRPREWCERSTGNRMYLLGPTAASNSVARGLAPMSHMPSRTVTAAIDTQPAGMRSSVHEATHMANSVMLSPISPLADACLCFRSPRWHGITPGVHLATQRHQAYPAQSDSVLRLTG